MLNLKDREYAILGNHKDREYAILGFAFSEATFFCIDDGIFIIVYCLISQNCTVALNKVLISNKERALIFSYNSKL